ncbi:hypothetical protein [Bacillus sp. FJAT-27251]|uniref:hypothetical protein n=1 Tax=Bacillus sp. FJAT-27251 TaxID=1684142 RepID=UPI0006A7DA71|nr:hypothetical protein [Bacillus sp. FJAT-27251]
MPRKAAAKEEESQGGDQSPENENKKNEIQQLQDMLAAVLNYLSDDEVEEIDMEYLLDNTEGLREFWNKHLEKNRKKVEEEIKKSLGDLSIEELEKIREQIKEKKE